MSKLDELLRELCPDGVEYKKLGEIATISRGGNFQKKIFLQKGCRVSITVRFIQNMACSRIRHLPL